MRIIVKVKEQGKFVIHTYELELFYIIDEFINYRIKGNVHNSTERVDKIEKLWLDGVLLIDKMKLL